jgi:AcrR family transcriptional regulator
LKTVEKRLSNLQERRLARKIFLVTPKPLWAGKKICVRKLPATFRPFVDKMTIPHNSTNVRAISCPEPVQFEGDSMQANLIAAQRKSDTTRSAILESALELASRHGLEGLSIGLLSQRIGMSKSGVFARFGSREELQIAVVQTYREQFDLEVFLPSLEARRGLPRLEQLFGRWIERMTREIDSGCLYVGGAIEYDDRPGPVRDALLLMVRSWHDALLRCVDQAIQEGHLRKDSDSRQLVYELHGMVMALHHDARFLQSPDSLPRAKTAFQRLIEYYREPKRRGALVRNAANATRQTSIKAIGR